MPSSLQVQTLQSSPAGIVLSPTEYSLPLYIHTEIEWDAIINRWKECNIKILYKFCVDINTKLQATLHLYIKHIYLPHISFPHTIVPSSLHVQTLQSSPAGIVVSPTSYSLPSYLHTEIERDAIITRLKECNTKFM